MKLVPGTYFDEMDDPDFKLPVWTFIEMNLKALHKDEAFLVDLFGVTKQEFSNWKKDNRNIPIAKIAVLCGLFGITIDQFYDRDFNDDLQYEDLYGLSEYKNIDNCKQLSYSKLSYLFRVLPEAECTVQCFSLGRFPKGFFVENNDPYSVSSPEDFSYIQMGYIYGSDVEYYCQALDLDVLYDDKSGKKTQIRSITFSELKEISKILKSDWGEDSHKHITVDHSGRYEKLLMLSENHSFLKDYLRENLKEYTGRYEYMNGLLELWISLRQENPSYDVRGLMAKTLLASGATLLKSGKVDKDRLIQLCRDLFESDIENGKEN